MISSENKNWLMPILIITLVAIVLCIVYFTSNDISQPLNPQASREFDYSGRPTQRLATPSQIILTKNEKLDIGRNCLVFKGIDKNVVIIDLYLLDMDSEQAYQKRFLKKEAKKELSLGEGKYRLVSVNDNYLTLKIINEPSTL
jgi:hypothetical protein